MYRLTLGYIRLYPKFVEKYEKPETFYVSNRGGVKSRLYPGKQPYGSVCGGSGSDFEGKSKRNINIMMIPCLNLVVSDPNPYFPPDQTNL